MKSFLFSVFAFVVCLAPTGGFAAESRLRWHESSFDHVLGTSLELKFETASEAAAAAAEKSVLAEIDRLAAILSGYDAASEFSRWAKTRDEPVPVSAELFEVLALFDSWGARTGGALNPAAEAAGQLWRMAETRQAEPTPDELKGVVAMMSQRHWRLDSISHTATRLTDVPLRLNSLTKGYIIDRACDAALAAGGIASVVVNIGGDLLVRGRAADIVGVADPQAAAENDAPLAHLSVRDRAVATSGDYRRGVTIGGHRFSHLIDPHSAKTVDTVQSATVVSPSATTAGALATALCVMGAVDGVALANTVSGVEYLLVLADGSRVTSAQWAGLEKAPPPTAPRGVHAAVAGEATSSVAASAPATTEVLIHLEVAAIAGGRVKRPFVAVWVEDKDHFPVRTVGLWFKGSRWLPDLRSWSRAEQLRGMSEGARSPESIASATRGPGKYTLRWDGRDDAGKPVTAGRYTVFVEIAREHGTHQVVHADIDTAGGAQRITLPANPELSAISLEVRPQTASR